MKHRFAWPLGGALALVGLWVLWPAGHAQPDRGAVTPTAQEPRDEGSTQAPLGVTPRQPLEAVLREADERESPGVAFTRAYYGDQADEVLVAMQEAGLELEGLGPPIPIEEMRAAMPELLRRRPDQRQAEYEGLWAWPEEGISQGRLRSFYSAARDLTADEMAGIDALGTAYEGEVRAAADAYFDTLDQALAQKAAAQDYSMSPYIAWPPLEPDATGPRQMWATVKVGGGWVIGVGLEKGGYPELIRAREEAHAAAARRDRDVRETVRMLTEGL